MPTRPTKKATLSRARAIKSRARITENKVKMSGATTRRKGHLLGAGRRKQGKRDSKGG